MDLKSKLPTGLLGGGRGVAGPLSSERLLKGTIFLSPSLTFAISYSDIYCWKYVVNVYLIYDINYVYKLVVVVNREGFICYLGVH